MHLTRNIALMKNKLLYTIKYVLLFLNILLKMQSNLNSYNNDGSFSMTNSNSFWAPTKFFRQFKETISFLPWRHDKYSVARTTHISNKFPWSQRYSSDCSTEATMKGHSLLMTSRGRAYKSWQTVDKPQTEEENTTYSISLFHNNAITIYYPVSILRKSISGRHRPVRVADGPMTARCRFT